MFTAAPPAPIVVVDRAGDSGSAPDITKVRVTTGAKGRIAFVVVFATPFGKDSSLYVYIGTNLWRLGPGGLEIGYFVRASAARQGYVTESTAALTRVGFEVCRADRIEIRIDPENEASKGVPRKLGFSEEATLRRRLPRKAGGPLRDVTIFTMFREDFDPALAPGIRAFDARGERVL